MELTIICDGTFCHPGDSSAIAMTEIKTKNTHLNPCFDFKTSSEDEAKLIFKEYNLSINFHSLQIFDKF